MPVVSSQSGVTEYRGAARWRPNVTVLLALGGERPQCPVPSARSPDAHFPLPPKPDPDRGIAVDCIGRVRDDVADPPERAPKWDVETVAAAPG